MLNLEYFTSFMVTWHGFTTSFWLIAALILFLALMYLTVIIYQAYKDKAQAELGNLKIQYYKK